MKTISESTKDHLHADPLTGEPGAHPVGTGLGATVGGITLGVLGATTGPIGAALGVAVGAVLGGLSGKGFAEGYDPTVEDAYWRENHQHQPFAEDGLDYEQYARAYRTGHSGYQPGKTFEEREADLQMEYEGGPQKVEKERAAEAEIKARATDDTIEDHLRTRPLSDEPPGGDADNTPMPETVRTHSLEWYAAREAARAAYQRRHAAEEASKNTGSRMPD